MHGFEDAINDKQKGKNATVEEINEIFEDIWFDTF